MQVQFIMITSMILADTSTEKVSERFVSSLEELDRRLQVLCEMLLLRVTSNQAQDYGSEVMFGTDKRYVVRRSALARTAYHALLSLVDVDSRHELEQVATYLNLERSNLEWSVHQDIPNHGSLDDPKRSFEDEIAYISASLSNGDADTYFPRWTSVYALVDVYLPRVSESDEFASPIAVPLTHAPHIIPILDKLVELVKREDEVFWDVEGWRSTKLTRLALPTTEFYDDERAESLFELQRSRDYLNSLRAAGVVSLSLYKNWRLHFVRAFKLAICSQVCMQLDLSGKISGLNALPLNDEHLCMFLQKLEDVL